MAGRGTDIMLGGNKDEEIQRLISEENLSESDAKEFWQKEHDDIVKAGGLSIIGVSRDTSRRLDNQLIGRAGRQGDPGETQFYLSLEDKIFETMSVGYLKSHWQKTDPNEGISFSVFSKIVKEVQKNLESVSFSQRKNLFKFDSINAEQREIFYEWRKNLISFESFDNLIEKYLKSVLMTIIKTNLEAEEFFANDLTIIEQDFEKLLNQKIDLRAFAKKNNLEDADEIVDFLSSILLESYIEKMSILESDEKFLIERDHLLKAMDDNYAENMSSLEQMRSSTGLRAYAQKNPLDEYQKEALEMFSNLVKNVKKDYVQYLLDFSPNLFIERKEKMKALQEEIRKMQREENQNLESFKQTTERELSSSNTLSLDNMFGFMKGVGI
jgi:preprotein translocase subunit SecA